MTLNDALVTVNSWSDTSITITIPTGAVSGYMAVSVAPNMNSSNGVVFQVGTDTLSSWIDADIGTGHSAGSGSYANSVFTVTGAGAGITSTADGLNFLYQPLSGNGAIIAHITSNATSNIIYAGLMIRETLAPGATNAFSGYFEQAFSGSAATFTYRASTDGNTQSGGSAFLNPPFWLELIRSGNTFSSLTSPDGVTWTAMGSQTVTMAQNVYIGMAVSSAANTTFATGTFDNVSVSTPTTPAPVISSLSISEGPVGTPVTITGTGFGASQGTSLVMLSDAQVTVNSWSNTSISVTIPSGAVSGPMAVYVGPTFNASNALNFTIASQITPVISNLAPSSNAIGASVTIIGSGFGATVSGSSVHFNGVSANATYWSATSVTVTVPPFASTGAVTLTLGADSVTSNGVLFTVTTVPFTVSSVSPAMGQQGTLVTITGTSFGSSQNGATVTLNGVTAPVISWANTSIIVVVPAGATSGVIAVDSIVGPSFTVNSSVTLTDSLSNQTTLASSIAGGKWYISTVVGSGCSSCDIRGNTSYAYDGFGNVLSKMDALGLVTSYTYDSNNNVASIQQPTVAGSTPTTSYTYNSFGEVLTKTDPLSNVTTNVYDTHGNLTSVTTPAPGGGASASVTSYAYNSLGELTQITDPLTHVTAIAYTTAGLIYTITDQQSNVTTYGYDSRGNRTSITDPATHQTTFSYDSGNRLLGIGYPDMSSASFTYDYRGRRITATDQNTKTTHYAYDDEDRLISVTDPATNVTQYVYDTRKTI